MTAPLAIDFEGPVTDGFRTVTTFIPKLLGAIIILIIGYFIAKVVAKVVNAALEKAGFDNAVEKGGIKKALSKSSYDASDIVAKLLFYVIFIPFISFAVATLGIQALQDPINSLITLLPKIVVAIIIIVIGAVVAGAVKKLIEAALGGLSYGSILANAASILILLGFAKAALDQVGIATQVTGPLLYAILGTVAGVIIVGAGGGLIKPMQGRWETMLNNAAAESDKIKSEAKSNKDNIKNQVQGAASQASSSSTTTSMQR